MTNPRNVALVHMATFSAVGTSEKSPGVGGTKKYQLIVDGTGSVSADGVVEGTNDPDGLLGWHTLATMAASGTTSAQDGASGDEVCLWVRSRCINITAGNRARFIVTAV